MPTDGLLSFYICRKNEDSEFFAIFAKKTEEVKDEDY